MKAHEWTDGGDKVLILRRCNSDMTSHDGFIWPETGEVKPNSWTNDGKCGNGLHGWPWGMGLGEGQDYDIIGDKWVVFAALPSEVCGELEGGYKCKTSRAEILFCGSFSAAWAMINGGRHRFIEAMALDTPSASSGDYSNAASSGNYSNAASSGNSSKAASSGDYSNAASSGNSSKAASSGNSSKAASSGDCSTAASSGNYSKAASSGDRCFSAVSGNNGMAKTGPNGAFAIGFINADGNPDFAVGRVGIGGIKADTWYKVEGGNLLEA